MQALKFLQTRRSGGGAGKASRDRRVRRAGTQVLMHSQGQPRRRPIRSALPATDDEIREKYLERAIRELNAFARELQCCRNAPGDS